MFVSFNLIPSLQTDGVCLAGYVCCHQEKHQSISSDQVTDILELSQQLAGEDTVRNTRQPVQVTSGRSEPGHNSLVRWRM